MEPGHPYCEGVAPGEAAVGTQTQASEAAACCGRFVPAGYGSGLPPLQTPAEPPLPVTLAVRPGEDVPKELPQPSELYGHGVL